MSIAVLLRLMEEGEPLRRYFDQLIKDDSPFWKTTIAEITGSFLGEQFKNEVSCSSATKESVENIARRFFVRSFLIRPIVIDYMVALTWNQAEAMIQEGQGAPPTEEKSDGSEEEGRGCGHEEPEDPGLPGS